MALTYDELEDDIIARLAPIAGVGVVVVAMPDTQSEFSRPTSGIRVTVSADSAEYGDVKSIHHIHQEENVSVIVAIQGPKRRGENGIYAVVKAVRLLLLGYQPDNYSKMRLSKAGLVQGEEFKDNIWTYSLDFMTQGRAVEEYTEETLAAAITEINVNSEVGESETRFDELDGGLPGSIYEFEIDGGLPDTVWE